jgi:hypothetical protein
MIRLSDAKLDHLMDVAEREQEMSLDMTEGQLRRLHAQRSIAASNLVLAELMLRERKL